MSARMCSCGRAPAESGCDLCAYCREDYERAYDDRRREEREWEDTQLPDEDFYISPASSPGQETRL